MNYTNILTEITDVLNKLDVPMQTGTFDDVTVDEFVVFIPIEDSFDAFADNIPTVDKQTARICVCSMNNPYELRDKIVKILLNRNFSILSRKSGGFDNVTKHHVMLVEVEGYYPIDLSQ
jgi:hypothetical protein